MTIIDTDILIDTARCIEEAVSAVQQIEDKSSLAVALSPKWNL